MRGQLNVGMPLTQTHITGKDLRSLVICLAQKILAACVISVKDSLW